MFSLKGRGFTAAIAIAAAIGGSPAISSTATAQTGPYIIINTSGDRVSFQPGSTSLTAGTVTGVRGVTYNVTGPGGFSASCTSDINGTCRVPVTADQTYTVTQVSAPSGYFLNPTLGIGAATSPTSTAAVAYNTLTVNVGTTDVTVPSTVVPPAAPDTARSGRWAVSRVNPPSPTNCAGRNVALLFDLSASVTDSDLARYKEAAEGFVEALRSSDTNVSVFTFGTIAPAPGNTTFSGNTSDPTDLENLLTGIANITRPAGQFTNWDAGIWQIVQEANLLGIHYDDALVLTDGDPTVFSPDATPDDTIPARTRFRDVENGIFAANALKAQGTRVISVGLIIMNNTDRAAPGSIANLQSISGRTQGSDYFLLPFDDLRDLLVDLALENCATISVTKHAEPTTYDHVGQTITYTYTVKNTAGAGGFPLSNITVTDERTGGCTIPGTLAPGQSATCTATYTIQPGDMTAGSVTNTATATGTTPNTNEVTSPEVSETVRTTPVEMLRIVKSASPDTVTSAGTTVTYTYTVTNVGDARVDHIVINDTTTGTGHMSQITCRATSLEPGQSTTCTATYTVTAADIAAGHVGDTAVTVGAGPNGEKATSNRAKATVTVIRPVPVTG